MKVRLIFWLLAACLPVLAMVCLAQDTGSPPSDIKVGYSALSPGNQTDRGSYDSVDRLIAEYQKRSSDDLTNLKLRLEAELSAAAVSDTQKQEMYKRLDNELADYRRQYQLQLDAIKEQVVRRYDGELLNTKQELVAKVNQAVDGLVTGLNQQAATYENGIKDVQDQAKKDLTEDFQKKIEELRKSLDTTVENSFTGSRDKLTKEREVFKQELFKELTENEELYRLKKDLANKMDNKLEPFLRQYQDDLAKIRAEVNQKYRERESRFARDLDHQINERRTVFEQEKQTFENRLREAMLTEGMRPVLAVQPVSGDIPTEIIPPEGWLCADIVAGRGPKELQKFKQPITLVVAGPASLEDVLARICRLLNVELVIKEDVRRTLAVRPAFKDTPAHLALKDLLSRLGCNYRLNPKTLTVFAIERRRFNIAAGPLIYNHRITVSSEGHQAATAAAAGAAGEGIRMGASTYVETQLAQDFWKDLEQNLVKMVSKDGWYAVNKSQGMVTAQDYPDQLDEISRYLEDLNQGASRQVLVRAKILEVALTDSNSYGIDWNAVYSRSQGKIRQISGGVSVIQGVVSEPTMRLTGTSPVDANGQFLAGTDGFAAVLQALESQGKVNVMSQPKIMLLNNVPAKIQVVKKIPYISSVRHDVTGITNGVNSYEVLTSEVLQGVVMELSARIIDSDNIYLNLTPMVKDLSGGNIPEKTFGNVIIQLPQTTDRAVTTTIKVKSGETVVIGGMIQESDNTVERKIPILGDIPLLGRLFKSSAKVRDKTEVVVLITPEMI